MRQQNLLDFQAIGPPLLVEFSRRSVKRHLVQSLSYVRIKLSRDQLMARESLN